MSAQTRDPVTPPQRYLSALEQQLAADRCEPQWEQWPAAKVLVGRRADFRIQWMATRLHVFTIAAAVPEISLAAIMDFTRDAQRYAKQNKKGLPRGLQTGIVLFPCLVSEKVDPAALAWAEAKQRIQFAVMTRPVVVDTTQGLIGAFRSASPMGLLYSPYQRRKLALYFDGALRGTAGV